jgi:hypothetical protein
MWVVANANVFVSAAPKEESAPGITAHLVAERSTERELFVALAARVLRR